MEEDKREEIKEKKPFSIKRIYEKEYKKLLIIPFLMLVLALLFLGYYQATTGSMVNKGISLKGGTSISILSSDISSSELSSQLNYEGELNIRTLSSAGNQIGIVIELDTIDEEIVNNVKKIVEKEYNLNENDFTIETIGSSLGESFFRETISAVIIAFILMGIVVFIYFRSIVPSLAVILAAFSDIVITLAIVDILNIKLSTAGIAAFLMLIGYSVDTDILLSTKVLKKKEGTIDQRIHSAMKTGIMMTLTTVIAIIAALIFSQNPTISQIMGILLIGLLVDLPNTWIQNVGILKWYMDKKKK